MRSIDVYVCACRSVGRLSKAQQWIHVLNMNVDEHNAVETDGY